MGLKVACITPWNVRCGIYTYSRNLTEALKEIDVDTYIVRLPRFGIKTNELMRLVAESIPLDEIDIIHVQHEYGLYDGHDVYFYDILESFKKPLVTTMHAVGSRGIDNFISNCSDKIIVHNEFCLRRFALTEKTVIIPHGCHSLECVPKEKAKQRMSVPINAPIVGYCGFISNYKGIETLIEAMTDIPQAALLICGGWHAGPDTHYITSLKENSLKLLEKRCMWTGYIRDEDMPSAYGAMDVVVYPSVYATESGALLTALGYGKAVIARNVPPFKEKERKRALLTFDDLEDLRWKIRLLLKDEDARGKIEAGARAYAEDNSWKNVAEQHLTLYEELI